MAKIKVFTFFLIPLMCITLFSQVTSSSAQVPGSSEESSSDSSQPLGEPAGDSYLNYGDFQASDEEAESLKFFQHGRFFGLSAGAGYMGATGNLGVLYNDSIPAFDVRVHYWFDFNFALTLGIGYNKYNFTGGLVGSENNVIRYDVSYLRMEALFRYYFDTYNASAPISFASPFLVAGLGNYSRSRTDTTDTDQESAIERNDAIGFSGGGGMQFTLKPKKIYLDTEFRFHSVRFPDSSSPVNLGNNNTLPNQSGLLTSFLVSLLFTW